jgi:hypothetical protein
MLAAAVLLAACGQKGELQPHEAAAPPTPAKITMFYVSPPQVAPGDSALLCYGTEGATEVALEPEVEKLSPSLSRCIEVTPKSTTTYTLHAGNESGGHDMKSVEVIVDAKAKRAAPPAARSQGMIQLFAASSSVVPQNAPVTLCYGVKGASKVRIEPHVRDLEAVEKSCFALRLEQTTNFTLIAEAADGSIERETVTVTVQ